MHSGVLPGAETGWRKQSISVLENPYVTRCQLVCWERSLDCSYAQECLCPGISWVGDRARRVPAAVWFFSSGGDRTVAHESALLHFSSQCSRPVASPGGAGNTARETAPIQGLGRKTATLMAYLGSL